MKGTVSGRSDMKALPNLEYISFSITTDAYLT